MESTTTPTTYRVEPPAGGGRITQAIGWRLVRDADNLCFANGAEREMRRWARDLNRRSARERMAARERT